MLTYTGARNRYGVYTNDSSDANLANGDGYINEAIRRILGNRDWPFLEASDTSQTTVASQQFYLLPYNYGKMIDVTLTIGTIRYRPKEVSNRDDWDRLNYAQNITSNIPVWYFIYNGQLGLWPTPSSSGNQITYNYKKITKDLSIPDYTTGAIQAATNGTAVVTGTSTAWTVPMAGEYIRITGSTTANTGDGYWYEVSSVSGTTSLTLVKAYQGTSITAGTAAYTLGQVMPLPEQYQIMPVYYAAYEYWRTNGNNLEKAEDFKASYDQMLKQFEGDYGQKSVSPMIDSGIYQVENVNPNLIITYP